MAWLQLDLACGLTTRETALIAWIAAFGIWALTLPNVRSGVSSVLKIFFSSAFLVGLLAFAAILTGLVILLLHHVGYWDPCMYKIAAFWFVGTGIGAVYSTQRPDRQFFSQLIWQNLALAATIEFVDNIVTFPLLVELFLIPITALLVGVLAIADYQPQGARVKPVVAGCLGLVGTIVLIWSLIQIIVNFKSVATIVTAREFLLPLILAVIFIPYLYVVRYIAVVQSTLHMLGYYMRDNNRLFKYARAGILRAIGLDLRRALLFDKKFSARLWRVNDEFEVKAVLDEFRRRCLVHGPGLDGH